MNLSFLTALALGAASFMRAAAPTLAYPPKEVRIIVPYAPDSTPPAMIARINDEVGILWPGPACARGWEHN